MVLLGIPSAHARDPRPPRLKLRLLIECPRVQTLAVPCAGVEQRPLGIPQLLRGPGALGDLYDAWLGQRAFYVEVPGFTQVRWVEPLGVNEAVIQTLVGDRLDLYLVRRSVETQAARDE